ncbi:MAG TPA: DUF885 family protein [Verrucomicrobiaceae bacterium]
MIFRISSIIFLFAAASSAETVRPLIEQYGADVSLLSRHYEIAGESGAAQDRHQKLLDGWLARVQALNFASLGIDEQVDAILLRNEIERSRFRLEEQREIRRELAAWLPFRNTVDALADARVHGDVLVPEKAAGALAPLSKIITKLRDGLKAAKEKEKRKLTAKPASLDAAAAKKSAPAIALPTPEQALRAADTSRDIAESLKRWFENYNGFLPEFGWWVKQPYDEMAKALEEYGKYLREEIAGVKGKDEDPLLGRAIGVPALQRQLDQEFIAYTPAELIALAEREFMWCETRMKLASQEMKLGDDWKKALARVKLQHVKPGEQEALVRAEAKRAIAFVKGRDLVTVPPKCEEWWGTRMLPPQEQRHLPYAAYGGHDILVAYANEGMKHEDKMMSMRGNNRSFTRNVVPHELIPGHHLQRYMADRERPYRRMFYTPFLVEGWALYWEMRLWEMQYQATPEDRIGALFWRMHRCARIIVTLKFHMGLMKPDEMVKFLVERVGHEKLGATSEVRRFIEAGGYSPLYQCGYMLGGLQLLALHGELVGRGTMSEKEFHDEILKLGPIPVELIRASLLRQSPGADFKTQWKFDAGN